MAQIVSKEKFLVVVPTAGQLLQIKALERKVNEAVESLVGPNHNWQWDADHTCLILSEKKR